MGTMLHNEQPSEQKGSKFTYLCRLDVCHTTIVIQIIIESSAPHQQTNIVLWIYYLDKVFEW